MDQERQTVERLLREVQEALPPRPAGEQVEVAGGMVTYTHRSFVTDVVRDPETGLIARFVGPDGVREVLRDERHRVVGVSTEAEELTEG